MDHVCSKQTYQYHILLHGHGLHRDDGDDGHVHDDGRARDDVDRDHGRDGVRVHRGHDARGDVASSS